jgi:hypothetical protein
MDTKAQIEHVAKAIKEVIKKDDWAVYFRDDGDTCCIDGHVDITEVAREAIKATLEIACAQFNGQPCYIAKDPDAMIGIMDAGSPIDMEALANAAIDAAHQELLRCEFKARPCYIVKDPEAAVGIEDRSGDYWIMEIDHEGRPRCHKVRQRDLIYPVT